HFAQLIAESNGKKWRPRAPRTPKVIKGKSTSFLLKGGRAWIDDTMWPLIRSAIETHSGGLIVDRNDAPAIALPSEEFANKDSELVACDGECRRAGIDGFYLELDVPGLGELVGGVR